MKAHVFDRDNDCTTYTDVSDVESPDCADAPLAIFRSPVAIAREAGVSPEVIEKIAEDAPPVLVRIYAGGCWDRVELEHDVEDFERAIAEAEQQRGPRRAR